MMGSLVFPFGLRPVGRTSRGRNAVHALAPRVSPAAVRVPDPRLTQLPLAFPSGQPQLFVHEGARRALERRIQQASALPVVLSVTDNRRHVISASQRGGLLRARIHHMFLDASPAVQEALAHYVTESDRAASVVVGRYIDANAHRIRAVRPVLRPLVTHGDHHDLLGLFRAVNEKYFAGTVDALITWGRRARPKRPRRTIKLGSYSAVERLIRIHPALDKAWVPRYFISYIIYHEMLHHVIPSSQGRGRRMLHPPAFRERERAFRDFERAIAWEKAHLGRLLRS